MNRKSLVVAIIAALILVVGIGAVAAATPPTRGGQNGNGQTGTTQNGGGQTGTTQNANARGGQNGGGQNGGGQNGGVQAIRIQCDVGHVDNVDPIVMPGMAGMSHYHQFFGNRSTDENTTTASLLANRPSTCRNRADFSAYWAPQLWQGSTAIAPTSITILYAKTVTSAVVAHPAGMALIAGNAKATTAQDLSVVSWYCGNNVQNATATPQACTSNQDLVGLIRFPECWNGKDLDSTDHKSHVTYAVNGVCATGTVALPQIQMHIHYPAQTDVSTLAMSSGSIYSLHADFMNGWNQRGFERQVAQRLR
jgi:hypothetical protein